MRISTNRISKTIVTLVVLTMVGFHSASSQVAPKAAKGIAVSVCDIWNNPTSFVDKGIQSTAVYRFTFGEHVFIYDPQCPENLIAAILDSSNEERFESNSRKIAENIQKDKSGTVGTVGLRIKGILRKVPGHRRLKGVLKSYTMVILDVSIDSKDYRN